MKKVLTGTYEGERTLFASKEIIINNSTFQNGESPLKESRDIELNNCTFKWKYPLWYVKKAKVVNTTWENTARSGIWYTDDIELINCTINAPKQFRRAKNIIVTNSVFTDAKETMWGCENINLNIVYVKGDYFGMNSSHIKADHLTVDGNYVFDGASNIEVHHCTFNSKDSFWNCHDVTICDSVIDGEYIGWNSTNLTFINCTIRSHQGLCYIKGLKLVNCQLIDSDLTFEYCEDIDAEITSSIKSVINPISGQIKAKKIEKLIFDEEYIDPSKTKIIVEEK